MKLPGTHHLILGIMVFLYSVPSPAFARSTQSCWGYGIAEFFVPGAGYGLLKDWEKAAIFGGTRWLTLFSANHYTHQSDYEEDFQKVYVEEENGGEIQQNVFLTRSTFYGNLSWSLYNNLTSVTIYDLYDQTCEKNPKTYQYMASPFQLQDYGTNSTFLAPMGGLIGALAFSQGTHLTYHVEGLTRNEMQAWSFLENQLIGIGEEMLFRGVIQRSFYNIFSQYYSNRTARWGGIIASSVIFGAAHDGAGGTATSALAFLTGIYLGWVYHPADDVFDLQQVIALHSWWDTLIDYHRLAHSDIKKHKKRDRLQTLKKSPAIPLINLVYRF